MIYTRIANAKSPKDDVWLLFDGGRSIESGLLKAFKGDDNKVLKKSKQTLTIVYDEASMTANIGRSSQIGSLKCTETCFLITAQDLSLPRRTHAHFPGTNFSDQLGPAVMESWDDESVFSLSRKDKRAVMGRFKVEMGGPVDAGLSVTSKWKNKETEPVFFHAKPFAVVDDLIHSYFGRAVVDFSVANGVWAYAAMKRRIAYVGVTCSQEHTDQVTKYLLDRLMQDAAGESEDPPRTPAAAKAKAKATPSPSPPAAKGKAKAKAGPQNADLLKKLNTMIADGGASGADPAGAGDDAEEDDSCDE
jgi:hypothetical protein